MTYIAPRTEKLARAMCEAVNYDPDELISSIPPHYVWDMYRWEAQQWIYEHSGGELPEREGEG